MFLTLIPLKNPSVLEVQHAVVVYIHTTWSEAFPSMILKHITQPNLMDFTVPRPITEDEITTPRTPWEGLRIVTRRTSITVNTCQSFSLFKRVMTSLPPLYTLYLYMFSSGRSFISLWFYSPVLFHSLHCYRIKDIIGMGRACPVITMVTAASLKSISLCKHHVQSTAAGESNLDSLLENSSK